PVTLTLTGRPLGPSRAVEMVLVDDDPQFWNQYDLVGLAGATLTAPIQQVQVDAFVGGTFTAGADGVEVTGGAWLLGEPGPAFALPAGVAPQDVQGLRFTFSRTDGRSEERRVGNDSRSRGLPIHVKKRNNVVL